MTKKFLILLALLMPLQLFGAGVLGSELPVATTAAGSDFVFVIISTPSGPVTRKMPLSTHLSVFNVLTNGRAFQPSNASLSNLMAGAAITNVTASGGIGASVSGGLLTLSGSGSGGGLMLYFNPAQFQTNASGIVGLSATLSNLVGNLIPYTNVLVAGSGITLETNSGVVTMMANVVAVNFLTNWANALSNLLVSSDTTTSNGIVTRYDLFSVASSNLSYAIGTDTTNNTATASNSLWTGNQSVNLDRMGLYHKQLTSGTGPTKVAVIGDSTDYFEHLGLSYIQKIGANGFDIPYGPVFITMHNGTTRSATDGIAYQTNWPGNYIEMQQNAVYRTTNNAGTFGGSIYCNRIGFRTIDYGEGGTLTFWSKTNGGTPVLLGTVNTAGPHKHTVTQYPVLAGWYQVVVSNFTAGTVRFIGALQYDTNSSGFCGIGGISVAGFSSDNISLYATNVSRAFFTSAAPCLTLYSEISDVANYTTNAAAISTWITNTFSGVGTFVMNGVWPIANESVGILQSKAMRNNICLSNNIPYFDTAATFGNYWALTNNFGISDGTHMTFTAHQVLADALWKSTATDSAIAVGIARYLNPLSGDMAHRSRDNVWGGYNQFGRLISTYGADAGINYYDQVEYPGNQYAAMAVYYTSKRLWFHSQTLGGPVLVLNGDTVRNQSLVAFDTPDMVVTNTIQSLGTASIPTNTASFVFITTNLLSGQKYTNLNQRGYVVATVAMTNVLAGDVSAMSLLVDQDGNGSYEITNGPVRINGVALSAGSEQLFGVLQPGALFVFTNQSAGITPSATIISGSCQWSRW